MVEERPSAKDDHLPHGDCLSLSEKWPVAAHTTNIWSRLSSTYASSRQGVFTSSSRDDGAPASCLLLERAALEALEDCQKSRCQSGNRRGLAEDDQRSRSPAEGWRAERVPEQHRLRWRSRVLSRHNSCSDSDLVSERVHHLSRSCAQRRSHAGPLVMGEQFRPLIQLDEADSSTRHELSRQSVTTPALSTYLACEPVAGIFSEGQKLSPRLCQPRIQRLSVAMGGA